MLKKPTTRLGAATQPAVQPQSVPAPIGGVNGLTSLMGMSGQDALALVNIMPKEMGLQLRKGYREWANGLPSDVRSIIPYDNQTGDRSKDRLFSVCAEGIYDTTLFNTTTPSQAVAFADNTGPAGYGVHAQFVADNGDKYVMYADEVNGLFYYDGEGLAWVAPNITFPDSTTIEDIAFVTAHKQRVWLVKGNSPDAYYLPIDSIGGQATKFNFASKFPHGGALVGLWSWTVDGGDGVDDFLIAVSRAGDVLVWYGPDPSQPEWSLRGTYFIGETTQSRKIAAEYAADLYVLSSYGLVSIRELLQGVDFSDVKVGPSAKITRFIRDDVLSGISSFDWQLVTHPPEGFLQVITPKIQTADDFRQYNQNLLTSAWGTWRGVPAITAESWRNEYFIGGPDGSVYIHDGGLDGGKLDGTEGQAINFWGLTSFQPYGQHGQYMRTSFIRTIGITSSVVGINVQAKYDYDLVSSVPRPTINTSSGGTLWDSGVWDLDVWDQSSETNEVPVGSLGLGRTMAIGFNGISETRVSIIGWDVMFDTGGLL